LPVAMPGDWPCTTGITLSPMSATRRPARTRRGNPGHAAALAEISVTLPRANPEAAGSDDVSRIADARTGGCRADQLAADDESHPGASGSQHLASRKPVAENLHAPQVPSPTSAGPDTTLPRGSAGERPRSRSAVTPGEGLARRTAMRGISWVPEACHSLRRTG
jgi:hypothetical protein